MEDQTGFKESETVSHFVRQVKEAVEKAGGDKTIANKGRELAFEAFKATRYVTELTDGFGFDWVEGGTLSESLLERYLCEAAMLGAKTSEEAVGAFASVYNLLGDLRGNIANQVIEKYDTTQPPS